MGLRNSNAQFKAAMLGTSAGMVLLLAVTPAAAEQNEPGDQVEEIIITAQKRETTLDKTAESISVVGGEALVSKGASGLGDLASSVPNLSFTSNFGISQIFVRGIGNNFYSPGGDPGVAFYSDGAYVSDQEATNVAFFDVQRIEVLRGPQGALYGRNATGGAVNLVSNSPTDQFEGRIGLVGGDFGRVESEGYLSGPIGAGGVTARLSYQMRKLDGFTRNELAQAPGAPDRFDDLSSRALRVQIAAPLPGSGSLRLIASQYDQDDNGPASKVLPDVFPQPAELLYGVRASDNQRSLSSQGGRNERRVSSLLAQYDQPVGDNTLTLIASLRASDRVITYDQDGTSATQSIVTLDTDSRDFNLDARLASPSESRLQWLVGATYVDFTQSRTTYVFDQIPLGFVVPGAPLNVPFTVNFSAGGEVQTRSAALYSDLQYALTDRLRLTGGLRYTSDRKSADEFVIFLAPQAASPSDRWSNVSGKIGLDYAPTDGTLFYASLARGFKSGAINLGALTPPVNPETVNNLEIGLKTSPWDRRAQFNLAAFASDYKDLQVLQIGPFSQILSNAAKARIVGIEAEGVAKPITGLTLRGAAAYTDATYESFVTPDVRRGLAAVDVSGNQLPMVAKTQISLGASYEWSLLAGYLGTVGVDYSWRDRIYFTEFNTSDAQQDAYGKLDLSASLRSEDSGWRLYGFVRNATDESAIGSMAIVSPLLGSVRVVNLIPPRHFGIGLDVSF